MDMTRTSKIAPRAIRRALFALATAALGAGALGAGGHLLADSTYTRADSDTMQRKIDQIVRVAPGVAPRTKMTPFSEREVNSYLRFHLRDQVPAGIAEPTITIIGDGRVAGKATVDLDEVSKANRSTSWFDPMRLLTGRLPVTATGILETRNGEGRFVLEQATISGLSVPKSVLQRVVSYYTSTPEDPDGIGLDDGFVLPAQIQEIRVQPGQALVVQ
jgi:hypothetical protein